MTRTNPPYDCSCFYRSGVHSLVRFGLIVGSLAVASTGIGQDDSNPFRERDMAETIDEGRNSEPSPLNETSQSNGANAATQVGESAERSEREVKLSDELRMLRRSESAMGANHPAVGNVKTMIATISEQLRLLALAREKAAKAEKQKLSGSIDDLSDKELRRLVVRMAAKIVQLETRVDILERQIDPY
ncbi:hypothetical protein CA13_14960 [Planctomycetes bacterium CA13]|uniref:Uncharacterized protein n=1 Tax=Novipirellula herctigrandis TaxID=2527986 RepID=A0A5C5Z071_9BACT|nr:hypothetical protein CA13_14960 [Planctomycetes bacterium CA13]